MTTKVNFYAILIINYSVEGLISIKNNILPAFDGEIGKRSPANIETK
jgi:hypothetical protein